MKKEAVSVFWFRRDLRLEDNRGLFEALHSPFPVLPVFIFDSEITDELDKDDARITFIYDNLKKLSIQLGERSSGMYCTKGDPMAVWSNLMNKYNVQSVYANEDYEPYAIKRDQEVAELLERSERDAKMIARLEKRAQTAETASIAVKFLCEEAQKSI